MKEKRLDLITMFFIVVGLFVALTNATLAWFSLSAYPVVSNIAMTVVTENAIEIALDENGQPGMWGAILDMSALLEENSPLRPVTFSSIDNTLHNATYGIDGRVNGMQQEAIQYEDRDGLYLGVEFWLRSSSDIIVCLSEPRAVSETELGSGTYVVGAPIWNGGSHTNAGYGTENTIRVGLKYQIISEETSEVISEGFKLFEPNADEHVDESTEVQEMFSLLGGEYIAEENVIRQSKTTWHENSPILKDTVIYEQGEFLTESSLFQLPYKTLAKVQLMIWMEGQDMDCTNEIAAEAAQLMMNLQFGSVSDSSTGTHGRP